MPTYSPWGLSRGDPSVAKCGQVEVGYLGAAKNVLTAGHADLRPGGTSYAGNRPNEASTVGVGRLVTADSTNFAFGEGRMSLVEEFET